MTFDEFIVKWKDKKCDFDGSFGSQCFDVYRYYCQEVLEIPQSPATGEKGAVTIWETYLQDYLERTDNTPSGIPQKGDIIIWGTKIGKYGHVGIFVEGTATKFKSFDANFPVGTLPHIQDHTYTGVLGWLRAKPKPASLEWIKGMYLEFGVDLNKVEGEVRGRVQEIFDGAKKYQEMEKKVQKLERDLAGAKAESTGFEERLIQSEGTIRRLNNEITDLRASVTSRDAEIGQLKIQVQSLSDKIDPDKSVIVSKDEYMKLIEAKKKVLEAAKSLELLKALFKKLLRR